MSILTTTNTCHSFPMYAFNDAPTMTCGSILKFCYRVSESQYITSFPPNSVLRHPNGTVLLNSDGIMLGERCSQSLSSRTTSELMLCFNQMELHRPFLQRGKEVANVCANFVVTGLKEDQNTKLKMTHSPKKQSSANLDMEM
jgi:hypothetical protein